MCNGLWLPVAISGSGVFSCHNTIQYPSQSLKWNATLFRLSDSSWLIVSLYHCWTMIKHLRQPGQTQLMAKSAEIKPPNHPPHHVKALHILHTERHCVCIYLINTVIIININIYIYNSPHLCVGFLFLVVHFRLSTPPLPPAASHSHISLTHNLSQHNLLTQRNVSPHN